MYEKRNEGRKYQWFRRKEGITKYAKRVRKGPDSPKGLYHPNFDYALSNILDNALAHARANGKEYWVVYALEKWANREKYSVLSEKELEKAKMQFIKKSEEEINEVLLMYIGTTKQFDIKR